MLAIIPARGGSKGLPGKNIKLLNGKPLIAYTIEAALQVPEITKVYISTDNDEIAKVALEFGAVCDELRPEHLATDKAKSIDVFKYTIEKLKNDGEKFEEVIILQPTSPLRKVEHIKEAIKLYQNKKADSVISYCQEAHPIVWHKYIDENGNFENIFNIQINNRQEEKLTYFPNGSIYIIKTDLLLKGSYYTDNSFAYIMDRKSSIDIDTIDDFEYCEFLINRQ